MSYEQTLKTRWYTWVDAREQAFIKQGFTSKRARELAYVSFKTWKSMPAWRRKIPSSTVTNETKDPQGCAYCGDKNFSWDWIYEKYLCEGCKRDLDGVDVSGMFYDEELAMRSDNGNSEGFLRKPQAE